MIRFIKNSTAFFGILLLFVIVPMDSGIHADDGAPVTRIFSSRTAELIKVIVGQSDDSLLQSLGGESIYAGEMLRRFYDRRKFKPAWTGEGGAFPHSESLVEAIEEVSIDGLVPEYYHLSSIKKLHRQYQERRTLDPEIAAEMDVLLTDAFLMLGCHFSAGCVDPVTIEAEWFVHRSGLDVDILLEDALRDGDVRDTLRRLLPPQGRYYELRGHLMALRSIAKEGGWQEVSAPALLREGDTNSNVTAIKKRLAQSKDMVLHGNEPGPLFDDILRMAIVDFQKRHGLKADGIVGPDTLNAMNVPVEKRLRQIEVNLERMRWLGRNLGHRYIMVNIADFRLSYLEHDELVMSMGVVAGKPFWNTPVFSEKMRYIILNPWWIVPESIAKEELLPKIVNDPHYLERQKIRTYRGWARSAEEIKPETVDWKNISMETFPFVFRQEPGPLNPLGRMKFMLPNKYNVYLHDTPSKGLFALKSRAFSHGCIRLERPDDLAEYLLQDDPEWKKEKLTAVMKEGERTRIKLLNPINVHVVYLTAWVDEKGVMQFRNDVYERDARLDKALRNKPVRLSAFLPR